MQHLRTQRGQLQHLLEGNPFETTCIGYHARISRVYPIDVGIDFTLISPQCRRHRDRRGIGATSAEGGDIAVLITTLKARHDYNLALIQIG